MEESTARTIVKVFAVLSWIGAAAAIVVGLIAFALGPVFWSNVLAMSPQDPGIGGGILAAVAGIAGIFAILWGVLYIFIGIGLWKLKNWARIITVVFAVLGVLSIFGGNFFGAIIAGVELWLFGFEKTVVGLFTGAKPVAKAKK